MIINEDFTNLEDFQRVCFTRKELLLLYFNAPFCPPCEDQLKILQQLDKEAPLTRIYSINIENQMFMAECFQIRGVPYIVAMKDKKVVKTFQGMADLEDLMDCIKQFEV